MKQKFTILFDLDGTLVDTAPDLMRAHNHVMKQFGYPTKSTDEIRNLVGQGAGAMLGRSIWGQAKKEFGKIEDEKIKNQMVKEFVDFYGKNILNESTLIRGKKHNNSALAIENCLVRTIDEEIIEKHLKSEETLVQLILYLVLRRAEFMNSLRMADDFSKK